MARFVTVAKTERIRPGQMVFFSVEGRALTVANVGGSLHAFDDTCTHAECSLADGDLEGEAVVCPCHAAKFDVRTGAVLAPPANVPIAVYPVRVEGDDVQVGL